MSTIHIRAATLEDLLAIEVVEKTCFPSDRHSSRRALRYSLKSPTQSVWMAVTDRKETVGVMVLYHHSRSLRIFSVAVLESFRGGGAGRQLVDYALALARQTGCDAVTLEAEHGNSKLVNWYEKFGFKIKQTLQEYYSPGCHAVRMRLILKPALKGGRVRGRS